MERMAEGSTSVIDTIHPEASEPLMLCVRNVQHLSGQAHEAWHAHASDRHA